MKQHNFALALLMILAGACARAPEDVRDDEPARAHPGAAAAVADAVIDRVPIDGAPVRGDAAAPVTLVMFTDYECPFCRRAEGTVAELRRIYGARLRVAVRQHPLPFHEHARAAAVAASAADEQGAFWAMHERLLGDKLTLDEEGLVRAAAEAGLDVSRWQRARAAAEQVVTRDLELAAAAGAKGTPAFFINGRFISGAQPVASFRAVIDEELRKAETLVTRGVRPEDVYATLMKKAVSAPLAEPTRARERCDGPSGECGCKGEPEGEAAAPATVEQVEVGAAPVRGDARAPVTVVVWSDFECPFCARSETTLRTLEEKYRGRVRFAFKNHPLPFHDRATLAARAAVAAGEQGKFWEYHDALFAHQDALDRPALDRYAAELGLDMARFTASLDAQRTADAIERDKAEASRLGVTGTPTFFVNGRRIVGAQPLAKFEAAIEDASRER